MKLIIPYLNHKALPLFCLFNVLAYGFGQFLQKQINRHYGTGGVELLFWAVSIAFIYYTFLREELSKPSKAWLAAFVIALIYWGYTWGGMECRSCSLV